MFPKGEPNFDLHLATLFSLTYSYMYHTFLPQTLGAICQSNTRIWILAKSCFFSYFTPWLTPQNQWVPYIKVLPWLNSNKSVWVHHPFCLSSSAQRATETLVKKGLLLSWGVLRCCLDKGWIPTETLTATIFSTTTISYLPLLLSSF